MQPRVLSFGSLSSPLARGQTQAVIDVLQQRSAKLTCQLTMLPSTVDESRKKSEVFAAASSEEVEHLLQVVRDEQVRLVVLEAADLGGPLADDMAIHCVPDRAPPFDAYLNRDGHIMDEMDPGSRIGVLSLRSRARMQQLWPDLKFEILHGGVDRAMEIHLRRNEIDGLVIPAAVTQHLGIQGIVAEIFAPEFILPGPGQGILMVVGMAGDKEARTLLADLHSEASAVELAAELSFQRRMVPDLDVPVGALARVDGGEVSITGSTGAGQHRIAVNGPLADAEAVGAGLAQQLLSHTETFADLLEADYADGLPADPDEDVDLMDALQDTDGTDDETTVRRTQPDDIDDMDHLRGFEDLAGVSEDGEREPDPDEADPYVDER